jgi:drug/metabolite transporter (DMT)-like permease
MREQTRWSWAAVIAMACWATLYPLSKIIEADTSPAMLTFLRFFIASVVLLPLLLHRNRLVLPEKHDLLPLVCISAFAVIPTALIVVGIRLSSSVVASILTNTNPLLVALLAPLLIHEKFSVRNLLMVLIGVIGISLIVLNGQPVSAIASSRYATGAFILLGASLTSACFAMFAKTYVRKYGGLFVTFFTITVGTVLFLIYLIGVGQMADVRELSAATWGYSALIGVVSTAIPFVLWSGGIPHLGATHSTTFKLLIPLFATSYSLLFLHEAMTVWIACGMGLVILGIAGMQPERNGDA